MVPIINLMTRRVVAFQPAKLGRLLDEGEQLDFLTEFPQLLIDWYVGHAMGGNYKINEVRSATNGSWGQPEFQKFYDYLQVVSDAFPVPSDTVLYRGISVHLDKIAEMNEVLATKTDVVGMPQRNSLHSWTDSLVTAKKFYQDVGKKNVPPQHGFVILRANMPAKRIGLSFKTAAQIAAWGVANASSTVPPKNPTHRGITLRDLWRQTESVVRKYSRHREWICLNEAAVDVTLAAQYVPRNQK